MMVEFAIIILLNRRKQATNNNGSMDGMSSERQHENGLSLRQLKTQIAPIEDAKEPGTQKAEIDNYNGNQEQGMSTMKKLIAGMSIPHVIDFMAFCSFICIFVWFNFDHLLPLLD